MELPPIPVMSIERILGKRDTLTANLTSFLGHELSKGSYEAFSQKLLESLPTGTSQNAVRNSIKGLAGKVLTDEMLLTLCWRIAANVDSLWAGKPVIDWSVQNDFEWIPVCVDEIYVVKHDGKMKNRFIFQSLSGSIVPRKMVQHWSFEKTTYLATSRDNSNLGFGFNRSKLNKLGENTAKSLFWDYRQYVGLRCFLLLDPVKSKIRNEPVATEVGHTSSTMSYNKKLITRRDRGVNPCFHRISDSIECHLCPYGTDKCEMATHPRTYEVIKCKLCKQASYCDKGDKLYDDICVNCAAIKRKQ